MVTALFCITSANLGRNLTQRSQAVLNSRTNRVMRIFCELFDDVHHKFDRNDILMLFGMVVKLSLLHKRIRFGSELLRKVKVQVERLLLSQRLGMSLSFGMCTEI